MNKEQIRKVVLSKRNALSHQEIKEKSKSIAEKLFAQPEFTEARTVCLYISFGSEVKTEAIIEECALRSKKIVIPSMVGMSGELVAAEFLGFEKLRKTFFGIMEPYPVQQVSLDNIDLVVAPGVAFDKDHNRVGFGKGYYDRFLAKLLPGIPKIALAFDLQIVEPFKAEETDVRMTKIITESRIL